MCFFKIIITPVFYIVSYRAHLENITSVGPRVVGSPENEILTVNYLLQQIKAIESESSKVHRISVDIQRPTGTFSIDFLGGFTSYYDNITNVVVKLEPRSGAEHAVLSNCHFDSVPNTPGKYVTENFVYWREIMKLIRNVCIHLWLFELVSSFAILI